MELRNLNTFLKVTSLQNFTQASRELGYSQSNVSAQIKQLEEEIGTPLFDRIGRNVYLTSYGEALVPYARQIVSTVLKMENFSKSEEALGGVIRFGMTDSLFELVLENALIHYHHRFPKVRLELMLDSASVLTDQLRHGLLDAACLIADPLPLSEWLVWDEVEIPIVLVANAQHPFAQRTRIKAEELAEQELILMEASAPYSLQFQHFLSQRHLDCAPFLRLQSADTARRLVEQEASFLSVLPLYTVQKSVQEGKLCVLRIPGWQYTQSVQLVLHRNKALTPQIEGFLRELRLVLGAALSRRLFQERS